MVNTMLCAHAHARAREASDDVGLKDQPALHGGSDYFRPHSASEYLASSGFASAVEARNFNIFF